jgi:hypothetical protein
VDTVYELYSNFISLSLDASPWLCLGLIIAGLMKSWLPSQILKKHLGSGKSAIIKAALIGAPLPLCSCGVIPVATELKRSGASAPATSSFLVATPETGIDSVSVSYALLGPFFAIYRPISAIFSAIITGIIVTTAPQRTIPPNVLASTVSNNNAVFNNNNEQIEVTKKCCASEKTDVVLKSKQTVLTKTLIGLRYASTKLIDDLIIWLFIGLIFASIMQTFLEPSFLTHYGSGIYAMLLMIVISIPMYICATASTPIAAGLIMAGISPGTALVFMMAGPATNISTLGVIKKEMGKAVLIRYLLGIAICSVGFGLLFDWLLNYLTVNITSQMQHSHSIVPFEFSLICCLIIVFLAIKPLRSRLL